MRILRLILLMYPELQLPVAASGSNDDIILAWRCSSEVTSSPVFCSCRTSSFATWVTGAKTLRTSQTGRRCLTVKGAAAQEFRFWSLLAAKFCSKARANKIDPSDRGVRRREGLNVDAK